MHLLLLKPVYLMSLYLCVMPMLTPQLLASCHVPLPQVSFCLFTPSFSFLWYHCARAHTVAARCHRAITFVPAFSVVVLLQFYVLSLCVCKFSVLRERTCTLSFILRERTLCVWSGMKYTNVCYGDDTKCVV